MPCIFAPPVLKSKVTFCSSAVNTIHLNHTWQNTACVASPLMAAQYERTLTNHKNAYEMHPIHSTITSKLS